MKRKLSTRQSISTLGIANGTKAALNVITPIFLVRLLDVTEFGNYRLLWLIANTVMIIAPLGMSRSLLYFLPRLQEHERREFVAQTLLFLALSGLVVAALISPLTPLLGAVTPGLSHHADLVAAFTLLWVVASLVELLPTADRNVRWQAKAILWLAIVRNVVIVTSAAWSEDLRTIFVAMIAFATAKVLLLLHYCVVHYGWAILLPSGKRLGEQLRYAVPFGLGNAIARIRAKIGQWVAAVFFTVNDFGIFSIAYTVRHVLSLLADTVTQVITPRMSKLEAGGDVTKMLQVNRSGNIAVTAVMYPVAAFLFAFATPFIVFLYTEAYSEAVPIFRIYLIGIIFLPVEVATVLIVLKQGPFVMKLNAWLVPITAATVYAGAQIFGLTGVAAASVLVLAATKYVNFLRVSHLVSIPLQRLQPWRVLFFLFAAATGSALASWMSVEWMLADAWALTKLLVGGTIFSLSYLAALFVLGYGWIPLAMLGRRQWQHAYSDTSP